jgi:hypothetical protein
MVSTEAKSLIVWRAREDSNLRRLRRAKLSRYLIVFAALAPACPRPRGFATQLKREWSLWLELGWIPGNLRELSKG